MSGDGLSVNVSVRERENMSLPECTPIGSTTTRPARPPAEYRGTLPTQWTGRLVPGQTWEGPLAVSGCYRRGRYRQIPEPQTIPCKLEWLSIERRVGPDGQLHMKEEFDRGFFDGTRRRGRMSVAAS